MIIQGIEKNIELHWNKSVKQLTENVKMMLVEIDPDMYNKCEEEIKLRETEEELELKRKKKWERIENAAEANELVQLMSCMCVSKYCLHKA